MKLKRITSILLTLCMLFSFSFVSVFAEEPTNDTTPISITFAAQKEGDFELFAPQKIEVADGIAEEYGYTVSAETTAPTVFDALVAAHKAKYGSAFTNETAKNYLDINGGWITTAFEQPDGGIGFKVNNQTPADNDGNGYAADNAELNSDDIVEFWFYMDTGYWSDKYFAFDEAEKTVKAGESFTLTLSTVGYDGTEVPVNGADEDNYITVNTVNADDGSLSEALTDADGNLVTPDENGEISLAFDEVGTFIVTANGFVTDEVTTDWETFEKEEMPCPIIAPFCFVNVCMPWEGDGTEQSPYILKSQEDLQKILEIQKLNETTFANTVFKLSDDITLPSDWQPIGFLKEGSQPDIWSGYYGGNGKDFIPFMGTFDGDNHTITIPDGGKPLFGYVRETDIKNLNIYGEQIAGYGLIDNYTVDYGPDGNNYATEDNPKYTAVIENCTLKAGTKTLKSGFIGGYAASANTVIIRNCTVEDDVTIGFEKNENNIGAFAGEFNGSIIGCKSYADIYGVDYVGGIVANKGQAMGDFSVYDCIFDGTITATGQYIGGIAGAGYGGSGWGFTANPQWPVVRNCISNGKIEGADAVGGIMGAEPGALQCWENGVGYVQNNVFSGSVSAGGDGAFTGGIIGFVKVLNRYCIISDNYFSDTCGTVNGIGYIENVETSASNNTIGDVDSWYYQQLDGKNYGRDDDPAGTGAEKLAKVYTSEEISNGTLLKALNSNLGSNGVWTYTDGKLGFNDTKHIVSVTSSELSNKGGLTQAVGEADILEGKTLTVTYNDGTTETVNADNARKEYTVNNDLIGKSIAAMIVYNNQPLVFRLNGTEGTSSGGSGTTSPNTITVSFTLLGDDIHGEGGTSHTLRNNNLKTWIAKTSVTVSKNSDVMDVFAKILNQNKYSWINDKKVNGTSGNYIRSITTPQGETLEEFTNGPNSGWMYTLNGNHQSNGIAEQTVKNGDKIVFHYTDDYTQEQGSWSPVSSGGSTNKVDKTENNSVVTTTNVSDKKATVTATENSIKDAISGAEKNNNSSIVIAPSDTKNATDITLEIPAKAVKEIADSKGLSLSVETDTSNVVIPNEALNAIAEQSKDNKTLNVVIETKTADDIAQSTEVISNDALKNASIVEITITSGDTSIRTFGGNSLSVGVPVNKNTYKIGKTYKVYIISADGSVDTSFGKCTEKDGKLSVNVQTNHLSTFVVTDIENVPFTDIADHWASDAIEYVYNYSVMQGVSETKFAPDDTMTRAMLVTVLYRLENPAEKAKSHGFADVEDGKWYTDAVSWAAENGIVEGISETEFAPNTDITREQMAAVLYRYAQYKEQDTSIGEDTNILSFDDAEEISEYAIPAMQWMVGTGLMKGETESTVNPQNNSTRAQVATILMRYLEL